MDRGTLKIEIPFTDHAHCIGRQGNQIQSIMLATETHIHFPDGNREANGIKSNQVSITGKIKEINKARRLIRDVLPMSVKFLIPPIHLIDLVNDNYPLFENVRRRFGVSVAPRPYVKTGEVFCIVRGLINNASLHEATEYLIQSLYGFQSSTVNVICQIEVTEEYHEFLLTRQQSKEMSIDAIEQYTHTKIEFPKNTSSEQGSVRRTSVTITGTAYQVCQARKLFDLCLPISLTFELATEKEPSRSQIVHIKEKLNVNINIRTRKDKVGKEIVKFVSIQTQEYNNENLFEARSMILNQSNLIDRTNHLSMISSAGHEHCIQKNSLMPSMAKMKLYDLLCSIQLEKYWPKFEKNQIDYGKFLLMTENDLFAIGIETFGARRRMQQAIQVKRHLPI